MPYNINLTNGSLLVALQDGIADTTSSSLSLFGKNYTGYGELLNENQVRLMENFANAIAPIAPLQGQLWWDTSLKQLKIRKGTAWKVLGTMVPSTTAPTASTETGDFWFDTTTGQVKVFDGTEWKIVGPMFTSAQGESGAFVETVTLGDTSTRDIVKIVAVGEVTAIYSNYPEFAYTGFAGLTSIKPGINLPTTGGDKKFVGTATNSEQLGGVDAASFARKDQNVEFSGTVRVNNNAGLIVGESSELTAVVSSGNVTISNNFVSGNINLSVNAAGSPTNAISIAGGTGLVTLVGNPVAALGAATKQYVDNSITAAGNTYLKANGTVTLDGNIIPTLTQISNLGSTVNKFNQLHVETITATSLNIDTIDTARLITPTVDGNMLPVSSLAFDLGGPSNYFKDLYIQSTITYSGDVAEKYRADQYYEPGTVLDFGGTEEVTLSAEANSARVAGVVSTAPATVMNNGCQGLTAVLALVGRVPVKVRGPVEKGDLLVSAGNGHAMTNNTPTIGTVIGKAIEAFSGTEGVIQVLVGRS